MEIRPTSPLNELEEYEVSNLLSRIVEETTAVTVAKEANGASADVALSTGINVVAPKQLLLSKKVDELTKEIDKILKGFVGNGRGGNTHRALRTVFRNFGRTESCHRSKLSNWQRKPNDKRNGGKLKNKGWRSGRKNTLIKRKSS